MIKFALIGTGNIAHKHAKAIKSLKNCKLVAVKGSDKERTEEFARTYSIKPFTDYDELLKQEIDAVDIVTLNNLHAELGIKAAKSGKHVLVEKPIDISLEKAEKLIKVCTEKNVKLSVISQHRFDKALLWLKKEIDKGSFGNLLSGNISVKWNRTKNYYESSQKWRKNNKISGGGVLILQAIHHIDLLLWIFGEAESIYGKIDTKVHDMEGEDTVFGIIKFRNGALATIQATTAITKSLPDILEIHGDKASIILKSKKLINKFDFLSGFSLMKSFLAYLKFKKGDIKDQIKDFADAIINNKEPFVTGIDGKNALEIVLGIYDSSRLNKEIKL